MYYIIYFLKNDDGLIDSDRKVRSFKTPRALLDWADKFKGDLDVDIVIKSEKEFQLAWKANLTDLSFSPSPDEKEKKKKRGPYQKRKTPEEVLEKADAILEKNKKSAGPKCTECGGKIALWNKTGICGNCQQGKGKKEKRKYTPRKEKS